MEASLVLIKPDGIQRNLIGEIISRLEQKGLIVWERTEKFRILFGYKLIAGEYPFGTQAHFLPLLDLQFGW